MSAVRSRHRLFSLEGGVGVCVILATLAVAISQFAASWADPAALWRDPYHDRNTHYLNGLEIAQDITALDPVRLAGDATADPTWPPLYPTVLGLVLAIGGPDHRLAILPSLAGWCATILLTWLITLRLAPPGLPRWFPGAVAAALTIASPAFRLLGTDVMFEALGAALSAMALYAFIRCDATASSGSWVRPLAIILTCLFLEKFNYWLLILVALGITAALGGARGRLAAAISTLLPLMWRQVLLSLPGLLGAVVVVGASVLIMTGPLPVTFLGRSFLLFPDLVLTCGYGILLLRTCQVWRRHRAALRRTLDPATLTLMRWHALPVALWFLVPQALTRFLWFVGPANSGASTVYDPWNAAAFQWRGFAGAFHAPCVAIPVAPMAVAGSLYLALRGDDGRRSVAIFAALSTIALVLHPQQQWRFQATMLFAVWICAGVGASLVLAAFARAIRLPPTPLAVLLAASLVMLAREQPAPLAAQAAIRSPASPSDLRVADAYLPLLRDAHSVGVVTTFGVSDLFSWTLREACRCRITVDQPWVQMAATRAEVASLTAAWLDRLQADHVLLVDAQAPYPVPGEPTIPGRFDGVRDALQATQRLTPLPNMPMQVDQTKITVWRVTTPPPHPLPAHLHLSAITCAVLAALVGMILLVPPSRRAG